MKIGERIKFMRTEMSLYQKDIAEKCFVVESTVAGWELGYTTPTQQAIEIIEQMYAEHQKQKQEDWFDATDEDLPKKLRAFRHKQKLTSEEFAKSVGTTKNSVLSWETGKIIPNAKNIKALRELQQQNPDGDGLEYFENFPEKIRSLKEHLSCTGAELEKALGVSEKTVRNWLSRTKLPHPFNIRAIEELCAKHNIDFNNLGNAQKMSPDDIRNLRKALGLTQTELADSISVHMSSVCNWETGSYPPLASYQRKLFSMRDNFYFELSEKLEFLLSDQEFSVADLAEELNDIINEKDRPGRPQAVPISSWLNEESYPTKQELAAIDKLCAKFGYEPRKQNFHMKIGERIKFMRTEMGLTSYELADLCGVHQSTIHLQEMEKRRPNTQLIEKIETLYNEYRKGNQHQYFSMGDDDFPKKLRAFRLERKMTQAELGKKLGVSTWTINAWENGNSNPTVTSLGLLETLHQRKHDGDGLATFRINFAGKLKQLLEHLSITQTELSNEIGAGIKTVSMWILGECLPNLYSVRKIEEFCAKRGLDFNDLPNPHKVSGDEIREFREEFGLSQRKFAEIIKLSQTAIGTWEKDGVVPRQIGRRRLYKVVAMRDNFWSALHHKLRFLIKDIKFSVDDLEEWLQNKIPKSGDNQPEPIPIKKWLKKQAYPTQQEYAALNYLCDKLSYKPPETTQPTKYT
jgi:transcriptional regulator with XRE-family HTH domain